jgi:hypothetical protein
MTDDKPRDRPAGDEPATDRAADESATDRTTDRRSTRDPPQPMTDDTDATDRRTTDPDRTEADSDRDDGDYRTEPVDAGGFDRLSTGDLRGLLDRIGLAALSLLAVIAGWGFYTQSGNAIRTWLDPAYQPIALAVFNLAVLFVALAGVAHQLRRIRATEP